MIKIKVSAIIPILLSFQASFAAEPVLGNLEHKECSIHLKNLPVLGDQLLVSGLTFHNCDKCSPVAVAAYIADGIQKMKSFGLKDNENAAIFDYSNSCVMVFQLKGNDVELISTYGASAGRGGLGNEPKSGRTPLGMHRTFLSASESRIISNAELNQNLDPGHAGYSNHIVVPTLGAYDWPTDFVLTRFIRLQGLEPSLNSNSSSRKFLFHGTHEEGLLDYDESGGCIRMANKDVIKLYEELRLGSLVNITAVPGQKAIRYPRQNIKIYDETSQLGKKGGGH